MWWLALGQSLDATVTFLGVNSGLVRETNILLTGIVVSPFFIPIKGAVGLWCGEVIGKGTILNVLITITFGLVIWNVGGVVWAHLGY